MMDSHFSVVEAMFADTRILGFIDSCGLTCCSSALADHSTIAVKGAAGFGAFDCGVYSRVGLRITGFNSSPFSLASFNMGQLENMGICPLYILLLICSAGLYRTFMEANGNQ